VVKFWDTSALVPVCVDEPGSAKVKAVLTADPSLVVWWVTRTECISAFMRQVRDKNLGEEGERQARQVLDALSHAWIEVQPRTTVRRTAERLLAVHPLRAADAFQLAAALQWCQGQPADRGFVAFDGRLREAAYKEGFTLFPATLPAR
jgi:predicted nucleic acid-binding protein